MPGWEQFVGLIESALALLESGLGSWGLAIILFTVAIKVVTWPLTTKQLTSSKSMQELQPRIKALQEKYKDDKEKQTQEMMALYRETGFNPLMGCLPMLLQFPIWIGLYQAILNLVRGDAEIGGFLFLPSLGCPGGLPAVCPETQGLSWVLDVGSLGSTWPYLVLPILTVVTQIGVSRLMSPTANTGAAKDKKDEDPTQAMMKQMTTIMPLMFGFFALQFPAGLAIYWVTNNILTFIQYWVLNRDQGHSALALASAGAADGGAVIEVPVTSKQVDYTKEAKDGRSRRKRKKR